MIEEEEKIVSYLEEIDENFSKINGILKQIKMKTERLSRDTAQLHKNCGPWMLFFRMVESGPRTLRGGDVVGVECATEDTQSTLRHTTPFNPFKVGALSCSESIGTSAAWPRSPGERDDSTTEELVDFDINLLPEAFKSISEIRDIYAFVKERREVTMNQLYSEFGELSSELIDILSRVLAQKRFVRIRGSTVSA